jgi:hypothetical protein
MDASQDSDALKRYPLYASPYLRRSNPVFNQAQSSSSFISPQSYSQSRPRTCSCPCNCTSIIQLAQSRIQTSTPVKKATTSSVRKRGLDEDSNKENQSPGQASSPPKKRKYTKRRTTDDKIRDIFQEIHGADWALSDFLYFVFRHKDTNGKAIKHDQGHGIAVQRFLTGSCLYTPAHIIDSWFHSPYGSDEDTSLMFSTMIPYTEISRVRSCLTSFAVQIVERRLVREATNAVKPSSGLHAVVSCKTTQRKAEWVDIGTTTVPEVAEILKKHQPLTWHYLTKIAARKPRVRSGAVLVRKRRPIDTVGSLFIWDLPKHCLTIKLGLYPCPCFIKFLPESMSPTTASGKGSLIFCVLGTCRSLRIRVPNW